MAGDTISRRDFMAGAAAAAGVWLIGQELFATEEQPAAAPGPPVAIGVIGLGLQGRDLLGALGKVPAAKVAAICDTYEPSIRRASELAAGAATYTDYRQMLESKDVQAVIVATPTHRHRQIVLDALQAGKHVYCEAPIAGTVDEAREIARAGRDSKQVFQAGLQLRADHLHRHVLKFVRTGVPGTLAMARAQNNKKQSWKRMAPTPEREAELNWRLQRATSTGLPGELGIHYFDLLNWYLDRRPVSVTGMGAITFYRDGREVEDTVQCIFQYPDGMNAVYTGTLVSSYDSSYQMLYGSEATILLKGQRSWMFKEADSAMLGWEVYAHKEKIGDETGIALVADATKIIQAGKEPGKEGMDESKDALYYAMEEFCYAIQTGQAPPADAVAGFQSAVTAIKAAEAVAAGGKVEFKPEWFELG
ncbi:MAG: NADH-dependent dehydrogenase [Armatimonadota bacterium]|nr:MAG: NADH-dependent dehydrogenase [Armatimonadota bacterium]